MKPFTKGDRIWVDNDMLGQPPMEHVVASVEGNKILYKEGGGCRLGVAHHSLMDAMIQAIRNDGEYTVFVLIENGGELASNTCYLTREEAHAARAKLDGASFIYIKELKL